MLAPASRFYGFLRDSYAAKLCLFGFVLCGGRFIVPQNVVRRLPLALRLYLTLDRRQLSPRVAQAIDAGANAPPFPPEAPLQSARKQETPVVG
jgi:hypothetical protein